MIQANFSITSLQQCYNKNNPSYTNSVPNNDNTSATTTSICRNTNCIMKDSQYDSYYDTTERKLERSNYNNNTLAIHSKIRTNKDGTITEDAPSFKNSIPFSNGCNDSLNVDKLFNTITQATTTSSKLLQPQPLLTTYVDNAADADADVDTGIVANSADAVAAVVSVNTIVTDVSISMNQKKKQKNSMKKTVSFATDIIFKEYSLIVYEHPYNKDKLALSLDWDHTESYTLPLEIVCKERFMKYYPPIRLSYSQRRYRLQQVSPINYTYWRDIILLGGTSRSSSQNSSNDSLLSITTTDDDDVIIPMTSMISCDNDDTNDYESGSFQSKLSNDSFSCLSPPSAATVPKICPDLTSLISRFSQPSFNTTMFLALSNLSDSDSDESDDEDNDTATTESLDNDKEQTDNDNDVLKTVVVTTAGRTSPTEQSIGLLSECDDDDNDFYSFNSNTNKDCMFRYGCENRLVTNNLAYQYHRNCRYEGQRLHLEIGEPQ